LTTSPATRPICIIAAAVIALVAISGWETSPVPDSALVLVLIGVVAHQFISFSKRERLTAERLAFEANAKRLSDFAKANAELSRELCESRLLEEETNLQVRAFDALLQGVIITDPHKTGNPIIYANERFTELTGYPKKEIIGRGGGFLHGEDTNPATVGLIREAIQSAKPCFVETLSYRRDGSVFWNALSVAPITDGGRLTHFVAVLTDISAQKKMEEQLRHAQKMEAVGHLAGGVAHDFNNLLTVINGCCELLHATNGVNECGLALVDEIHKSGERAASLTGQLLAYSRKTVLQPRVLCLNDLVKNLMTLLQRLIGEHVRLCSESATSIGSVRVDAGQVEQVLVNLVVNARDAMPSGGQVTIETREVRVDADFVRAVPNARVGSYVRVCVRDTGHGMDKATLDRLFEPFFTTKPVGKGTGLGLAMVYGIMEASGGFVQVTSKPGAGTTFRLFFPVCDEHVRPVHDHSSDDGMGGSETVLVVEDEDGVRALTVQSLLARGYNVLQAVDGAEALHVAADHDGDIDLLLSDVVMPGMSGNALLARLTEDYPHLRVIYMSGYMDDAVVRHGVSQMACDFLQKPFTLSSLSKMVRDVLDRADPSAESTPELADTVA